ncbi:hypothetical protein [Paenibacillus mendelii]|uniref:Helix-turn-helix type 11 domain-containing protein n=1 Tax=Paenibacillus mendelii TaxID=206163 RepID=A0ABV6J6B5_9BACL|nr:hypothetical protein [Paenibacillus mendelii]
MASLHRIQWIDARVRQGQYPNIQQMMERFEISRRQALRDVEYLRDSLGAPLDYCPKRKGYYYTDHSFAVPGQLLTADQQDLDSCLKQRFLQPVRTAVQRLGICGGQNVGSPIFASWPIPGGNDRA